MVILTFSNLDSTPLIPIRPSSEETANPGGGKGRGFPESEPIMASGEGTAPED